jgi:rRNA-processing protein FCF1
VYQVVIDTNVLVAALVSSRGASHRLLRLVGDPRWRINLSVPLVLEYEQTLKRDNRRGAMTLTVTVPDAVYRQIAELASRQQVSVERIVAAALAEQLSGWNRLEQMAERGSRERFLAALDKVPAVEPAPEDRL